MEPIQVLLVEDDEADVELTKKALEKSKIKVDLNICFDGVEAMQFLNREGVYESSPRPDLILLDLNMPRKDGRKTLQEIKAHDDFKDIPVIILTTSESDEDIIKTYKLGCNCYVSKPIDLVKFIEILKVLNEFWFTIVKLPSSN